MGFFRFGKIVAGATALRHSTYVDGRIEVQDGLVAKACLAKGLNFRVLGNGAVVSIVDNQGVAEGASRAEKLGTVNPNFLGILRRN